MAVSAKRNARIEITSSAAGVDPGINDARRKMRGFQREQDKLAKQADRDEKRRAAEAARNRERHVKATLGAGQSIAAGMATAAGFDIAGGVGGIAHEIIDAQKELTRFQIDAQLSAAEVARFNDELTSTSNATGQSRFAILKGAHAYQILTGDAKGAVEASKLFAEVANASGASMEDIAATAAAMKTNLAIDPKDFRAGFDILLSMGHKSSVELRDFAGEMASLSPQFAQFGGGGGAKGLAEMAAALEAARHGFGSASEAATGLSSLMTGLVRKRKKLEGAGIQIIDPKTHKLRDLFAILDEMKAKKFDLTELTDELGRMEGVKAALQLVGKSNAEMHDLYNTALNSNQVAKDNATYMESSSGRIAKAWEQIKNTIADALSPERVQAFASMLETAGDVWKGIFSIGRKVRGAITGTEPVSLSEADRAVIAAADYEAKGGKAKFMRAAAEGARGEDAGAFNDDKKWATVVEFARKRAADVASANAAANDIMGAENDERTTPESIQRAIVAHASSGDHSQLIGEKYLKAAGITPEREHELIAKNFKEALSPLLSELKDLNDNLQKLPPPKIEGSAITKAHNNNITQRTRPGGR